jgi:hypothetical protein
MVNETLTGVVPRRLVHQLAAALRPRILCIAAQNLPAEPRGCNADLTRAILIAPISAFC